MDNVSSNPPRSDDRNGPASSEGRTGEPAPMTDTGAGTPPNVSRAPLNLGGATGAPTAAAAPKAAVPPRPVPPKPAPPRPAAAAGDRITACKTFFTKLHPGAIHFLDEQIAKWLRENPQIVIKHTNVIQGEITEKKTEPNILIIVWY
ncbi:MAG: hypothetical protein FJ280_00545 [Planctomycetes bacterium]|nr:hypothetical protein [Planctomycetota bacterium]